MKIKIPLTVSSHISIPGTVTEDAWKHVYQETLKLLFQWLEGMDMQYFWTLWYVSGHFLSRTISLPSFNHVRTIHHFSDPDNSTTSTADPNDPLSSICISGIFKGNRGDNPYSYRMSIGFVLGLLGSGGASSPPPPVDKVHALPKVKSGIRHWVDHIFNFFTITPSPAVPIEKCISKYLTYIADITAKATPSQIHLKLKETKTTNQYDTKIPLLHNSRIVYTRYISVMLAQW